MKKHNFSAGPAILPSSVIEKAAQSVLDLDGMGLSILEISHRSDAFREILGEARSLTKKLLHLNDDYEVLFLTGGASTQFFMTPLNLLENTGSAAYIDTGVWSAKAIKEAQNFGRINVIASSKDKGYSYIPKEYEVPSNAYYLHLTSNNTVAGTQFHEFPDTNVPIVCDMSSDIFSYELPKHNFGLIYAGAQKNLGPAGTTIVIVRKDVLGKVSRNIPTILDYNTHIKGASAFNTPPVYPIYVCLLTMKWIEKQGGVKAMEAHNDKKASMLYGEIDTNPLFEGVTAIEDRSKMNATFVLKDKKLESAFNDACANAGIVGIKGHRLVGGYRASIYNAMPLESVQVLIDVMRNFA